MDLGRRSDCSQIRFMINFRAQSRLVTIVNFTRLLLLRHFGLVLPTGEFYVTINTIVIPLLCRRWTIIRLIFIVLTYPVHWYWFTPNRWLYLRKIWVHLRGFILAHSFWLLYERICFCAPPVWRIFETMRIIMKMVTKSSIRRSRHMAHLMAALKNIFELCILVPEFFE